MSAASDESGLRELVAWLEARGYRLLRVRVGDAEFEADRYVPASATGSRPEPPLTVGGKA